MTGMPVFCMEANLKSGFKADERDYGVRVRKSSATSVLKLG